MDPQRKEAELLERIRSFSSALVAFSGGVDSSYLAYMCNLALGPRALAVTAVSPAVPQVQRDMAVGFARLHGLRHFLIDTAEMEIADYTSNPVRRCYFCKTELYGKLLELQRERGLEAVFDGANLDDLGDYRPGKQAAQEKGVISPLVDAGIRKSEIRELSRRRGLETWDKPAMPCLSSRFPYGVAISRESLSQVEQAEDFLRGLGLREFRVRHHDTLARIEVDRGEVERLLDLNTFDRIHSRLRSLGYLYVTLDLRGFRSGALNEGIATAAGNGPAQRSSRLVDLNS